MDSPGPTVVTANLSLRVAPSQRVPRTYGFERGYVASTARSLAPPGSITADSRNYLIAPQSQGLVSRLGRATQYEAAPATPVGLLEAKWAAKPRRLVALVSPTLADGFPTPLVLFTNEAVDKRHGQLWFRSSNGGGLTQAQANHTFGEEFSTTTYPQGATETLPVFKMVPLPYITQGGSSASKATGLTRCASELVRRFTAPGARSVDFFGDDVHVGNFQGCPFQWNREWNDTTALTTNMLRARPAGYWPPLFCPSAGTETAASSTNDRNWRSGDACYRSAAFKYRDGGWSRPFEIRPQTAVISAARGGYVMVGDGTTESYKRSIQWDSIPVGGKDVESVALLRTFKININSGTSADGFATGAVADIPLTLYIVDIVPNGTTTYVDTKGSDQSLGNADLIFNRSVIGSDPAAPRADFRILPPCHRYSAVIDGRRVVGYTRFNPCALVLAPTGKTVTRDMNVPDGADLPAPAATMFALQVKATTNSIFVDIVLIRYTAAGAILGTTTIAGSATKTLRDAVDEINATLVAADGGEWAAQLAPGADGSLLVSTLALTTFQVANCTCTGTTLTTTASAPLHRFEHITTGMWVVDAGVGIAQVLSKESDTSLTLSATITAANITVRVITDTGDNTSCLQTGGGIRAHSPSLFVVLPFDAAFLEGYAPGGGVLNATWFQNYLGGYGKSDPRSLYITGVAPGTGALTPNLFINDGIHRRGPPASAGTLMGLEALNVGGVVCYSDEIYQLQNRRDGNTGEDVDYQFFPVNLNRGCISPKIVKGDDWIGYWTRDGFAVVDSTRREVIITGALHEPGSKVTTDGGASRSILAYELEQSGSVADSDREALGLDAWIDGTVLWLGFRTDASTRRCIPYDFSEGADSSGLAEVLDRDGNPRPFGAQQTLPVLCGATIGSNSATLPPRHMAMVDTNAGSTGDGQIEQLETGLADNGVAFVPVAYLPPEPIGGYRRQHRIHRVTPYYRARAAGLKLLVSIDTARATLQAIALAANSEDDPAEATIPDALRLYTEFVEFGFSDDAVSADRSELFRLETEFDVANM